MLPEKVQQWILSNNEMLILILSLFENTQPDLTIELQGNIFFSSPYLMKNPEVKSQDDLENLINSILTSYTDAGFAFCRIYPQIIYSADTIKKIVLKINEGKRILIKDILFHRKGKTNTTVLKKIMGIDVNSYFSAQQVASAKKRLLDSGAFEQVTDNITRYQEEYYLLFDIKEKNSDYLNVLGSFGEDIFNVSAALYSFNLLGTMRKLRFSYEYKKLFSLEFVEPVLLYPVELAANFSLLSYDTMRLTEVNGKISAPLTNFLTLSLISGIEITQARNPDSTIVNQTNNLLGVGAALNIEQEDLSFKQHIRYDYLFRIYDRYRINYDGAFRLKALYIKPHYRLVKTSHFEFFDYYRLGGAKDLRGYMEEEFIVDYALWLNCEYKYLFIYPLFDIGLIKDQIKYSYGFGIDLKSNIVDGALFLALPESGTWQDGKIHLLFEKNF